MTPELRAAWDADRHLRANELYQLANLLEEYGLANDTQPIRVAGGQCLGAMRRITGDQPDAGRDVWGYDVQELRLRLEPQRHCRPRGAATEDVTGTLTIKMQEYVPSDAAVVGAGYDLIRNLNASFHYDVEHVIDGAREQLRAAWHVDSHLHVDTMSHAAHPRFHFQVGGELLDDVDERIRGVFISEAPRIPHPPLDELLAVDFVLSQYCFANWRTLRDIEPRYTQLRAQVLQRYWAPYYQTISRGLEVLDDETAYGLAGVLLPNIGAA